MEIFSYNRPLTLKERADHYNITFKKMSKSAPLVATNRWLYGTWMMGNDYSKKTEYYGAYPYSYLDRVMALFPDCKKILHLFSGSLDEKIKGDRFDINPDLNPDIVGDAEELSKHVDQPYDLIIADPPYSEEDAKHYGTSMINRQKVVSECIKVLGAGGFLVWLDQVLPMYSKSEMKHVGVIAVIISTNHRVRCVFIWQKKKETAGITKFFFQ